MADIPKSLGINPRACTPEAIAKNFEKIIEHLVNNDAVARFKLTAALEHCSLTGAAAVMRKFDGTNYEDGDVIQVFDWNTHSDQSPLSDLEPFKTMGWWWGEVGAEGFAKRREVSATTGRTEYDIIWMETQHTVRFKLTEDFNTGNASQANGSDAVIRRFNGTEYEDSDVTIRVYDFHGQSPNSGPGRGMWQGVIGMEGIAVMRERPDATQRAINYKPEYDVIWMEQYARYIEFTLTSTFSTGTASATVQSSYGQGVEPASPLNVHDDNGNFTDAESGDKGLAILSEYATQTTPGTPYYKVAYLPPKNQVVRFRLTADLSTGGSAAAVKRLWNGSAYVDGSAITVFDWWGISQGGRGMWQAVTDMEGMARVREGSPNTYDIIWMEAYAFSAFSTLGGSMSGGTATAVVNTSWEQGVDPGASHTIHDDRGAFPDAISGCKASLSRSEYADAATPGTPYYKVVHCTHPVFYATATLTAHMCADAPAFNGWTALPIGDFQVDPGAPGAIANPRQHSGRSGDTIFVVRTNNASPFTWEVIDVTKHTATIHQVRWNDDLRCLQKRNFVVWVETCQTEQDWESLICAEPC